MFGAAHKKDTAILTNAPWITDVLCDNAVRPHHHVPLIGLVADLRSADEEQVFYTELAAEYPEGLCNRWAGGLGAWLAKDGSHPAQAGGQQPVPVVPGACSHQAVGTMGRQVDSVVLGACSHQAAGSGPQLHGEVRPPKSLHNLRWNQWHASTRPPRSGTSSVGQAEEVDPATTRTATAGQAQDEIGVTCGPQAGTGHGVKAQASSNQCMLIGIAHCLDPNPNTGCTVF
jgi:hypothetical protein